MVRIFSTLKLSDDDPFYDYLTSYVLVIGKKYWAISFSSNKINHILNKEINRKISRIIPDTDALDLKEEL